MHDKYKLKKNIIVSLVSFLSTVILVFISYKLVISNVGITALGLWSLLMSFAMLAKIGDAGMGYAIVRFISPLDIQTDSQDIRRYIDTGLVINILFFVLLLSIGYLLSKYFLASMVEADLLALSYTLLPLIFACVLLGAISGFLLSVLKALHCGYLGGYITIVGSLSQIIGVVLFIPRYELVGFALAIFLQHSISIVIAWWIVIQKVRFGSFLPVHLQSSFVKRLFSYSLRVQIANVLNGLFEPVSKILFGHFSDLKTLGYYELAYKSVVLSRNAVVTGLFAAIPTLTDMMDNNKPAAYALYRKINKKIIVFTSAILICLLAVSPVISLLWLNSINFVYIICVVALCIAYWFNTYGATAYSVGLATGKMKNNIYSSILCLILLVATTLLGQVLLNNWSVLVAIVIALVSSGLYIKYANEKEFISPLANKMTGSE